MESIDNGKLFSFIYLDIRDAEKVVQITYTRYSPKIVLKQKFNGTQKICISH